MKKTLTIRMPEDLMKHVEKSAKEDDRSTNSMIAKIVRDWVKSNCK